ncbi:Indoleamine 2,3-dioxygenase [Ceratocystis pirilliformis]|uniref:Indoleamine 2,3-dioxygenase n=1 Tax=Ceratocystis pirilliformis TaxID=259994 RepID=A0ABR3ZNS2_9PEZI
MLPAIPDLRDVRRYGVSPKNGFLPDALPLTRLPDPYYNKWEAVMANLQALILSRRLRGVIDRLPVLSTIGLEDEAEWRRAYMMLCFMAHAYIWGDDRPEEKLPRCISAPLLEVSKHLELPPVATYAAVCLWNFKPLFIDEDIDNLENLSTLNTFTGSLDESWFYLVSVAIEARGAPSIGLLLKTIQAVRDNDPDTAASCLRHLAELLTDLTTLLERIHERCAPFVFYNQIRPFLAGSRNMADAGLPSGVLYEDARGYTEYRQYAGGSNAQSSLIQFFDIALGISHRPTGQKSDGNSMSSRHSFMEEMLQYMPGGHARFLRDVELVANIREYVHTNAEDQPQLSLAYDACIAMLSAFRDKHINIVTRYIVVPSRESRPARAQSPEASRKAINIATSSRKLNMSDTSEKEARKKLTGTGGTALIPFLKQARDETGEVAAQAWARKFMKRQGKPEGQKDFFLGKTELETGLKAEEDLDVAGLAGAWSTSEGGICHY